MFIGEHRLSSPSLLRGDLRDYGFAAHRAQLPAGGALFGGAPCRFRIAGYLDSIRRFRIAGYLDSIRRFRIASYLDSIRCCRIAGYLDSIRCCRIAGYLDSIRRICIAGYLDSIRCFRIAGYLSAFTTRKPQLPVELSGVLLLRAATR